MEAYEVARNVWQIVMILVVTKAIVGFHFPWETCQCCGKKYRDHQTKITLPLE
jgi:hypothetical protein